MKKLIPGFAIAVLAVGLALVIFTTVSDQSANGSALPASSGVIDTGAPAEASHRRVSPASVDGTGLPRQDSGLAKKVVERSDLLSTDTRLVALSPEEAAWLDRHGYPKLEMLAQLPLLDSDELLRKARAGDGMAASLLGVKAIEQGDHAHALSAFGMGQVNGSLYAQQRAVELIATSTPDGLKPLNNDTRAILIAGLEVARMLGDHRAGALSDRLSKGFDRRRYSYAIQQQTVEFMRQYTESFSSRGKSAPGPDPRPNAALWAQIDAGTDPSELITIVDRGGG